MDDFFLNSGGGKKKKRDNSRQEAPPAKSARTKSRPGNHNAVLDAGDELGAPSSDEENVAEEEIIDPYANETPDDKRLRLAQELIERYIIYVIIFTEIYFGIAIRLRSEHDADDDDQLGARLKQEAVCDSE